MLTSLPDLSNESPESLSRLAHYGNTPEIRQAALAEKLRRVEPKSTTPSQADTANVVRFFTALSVLQDTLPTVTGLGNRWESDSEDIQRLVQSADLLWDEINQFLHRHRLTMEKH